jgi:hypothetical protein
MHDRAQIYTAKSLRQYQNGRNKGGNIIILSFFQVKIPEKIVQKTGFQPRFFAPVFVNLHTLLLPI